MLVQPNNSNSPATTDCPFCKSPLAPHALPDLPARDYCVKCNAIWLKKGDLGNLCFHRDDIPKWSEVAKLAKPTGHKCPSCPEAPLAQVPYAPDEPMRLERCPLCERIWVSLSDLAALRRWSAGVERKSNDWGALLANRDSWEGLYAFPIAVAFAAFMRGVGFGDFLLLPVVVQLHELGHAVHSWLSGRFALPLIGITLGSENNASISVYLFTLFALGGLFFWCRREGLRFVPTVASLFLLAQTYLTFLVDKDRAEMWIVFGGVASQFYFSTLLILAFFYRMPAFIRWDYWKIPCLMLGMYAFDASFAQWRDIASGAQPLPMGSLFNGSGDDSGDMNRLINAFQWTQGELVRAYLTIGYVGTIVMWVHYFRAARKALRLGKDE